MMTNQTQEYVNKVIQQLNKIQDLEITDIRKGKEDFGRYLFGTYKQDPCMIKIISIQDDQQVSQQKNLQILTEKVNRLKMCSHKNIVKYYDSFQIEDNFYIVMEKVECSLKQWIDDNRKNQIEKVQFLRFALQMVEVADYLHQKKHILSNISLKNIFLDKDLNIKFSTFTVKQEVSVYKLLNKQIYALENNELIYFPLCLIDEGGNENLIIQSSKQDMYAIGLCLYCLTGVSYMDVLNYIQGGKFQANMNLGVDINLLLQLMLFRNCYSFVPSPCYFIESFQKIISSLNKQYKENENECQMKFQMEKDEEVKYLQKFQRIVKQIDYIKEEEQSSSDDEKSEESESKDSDDVDRLIDEITKLIQVYKNCDILYLFLGHCYDKNDDFQQSLNSYQKAFQLNQYNDIAVYGMGLAWTELENNEESLICYDKYVNLNPFDDEVYNNIGEIYLKLEDFQKSKIYFEKSLEINSRQYIAFYNLSQHYFSQKMFQKGSYFLKKAKKIQSDDDTFQLLGYFYEQKQEYEKSLKYYSKLNTQDNDVNYVHLSNHIKSLV
ncbi:hypothetical protein ABPG73_010071 [Tetrahymena malaccensis]